MLRLALVGVIVVGSLWLYEIVVATDVDGPDCGSQFIQDFGDAPEGIAAYPTTRPGVIGHFPTCLAATAPGNQTLVGCATPPGSPPGVTGFVRHVQTGNNYWLGCYTDAAGAPRGIDSEADGKVRTPGMGQSACAQIPTDCVEPYEGTFGQDECYADGSDAGVRQKIVYRACPIGYNGFDFEVYNCGGTRTIYVNVLFDWNKDGDWNDEIACTWDAHAICVPEWSVRNWTATIVSGCNTLSTPQGGFDAPPVGTDYWMRITISDDPVSDDFPWAGSAPGELRGGETEDYQVDVVAPVPIEKKTWGEMKSLFKG